MGLDRRTARQMEIWPGEPFPLGATYNGSGTNFSLFSEAATGVTLCLFDAAGVETHVNLPEVTALCWVRCSENPRCRSASSASS